MSDGGHSEGVGGGIASHDLGKSEKTGRGWAVCLLKPVQPSTKLVVVTYRVGQGPHSILQNQTVLGWLTQCCWGGGGFPSL